MVQQYSGHHREFLAEPSFRGSSNGEAVNIEIRMPRDSEIIADIHNHPRANFASENSAPSGDDWNDVDRNYFGSPPHTTQNNFSMYIISPTGELAEFDYNDGRPKKSSPSHKRDAKSECKS